MKLNVHLAKGAAWLAILLVTGLAAGCGSNGSSDPAVNAQNQEKERLQSENQELPQVRQENEEVQRLSKENQELPKLRSQYQEAARLKKDNEVLRQQIAKLAPAATHSATSTDGQSTNVSALHSGPQTAEKPKENPGELTLNEGDDILVDPKELKKLLPDFDWEKLGRKEPMAIRSVLEKDGYPITNSAQLKEYGITNFTIQRAVPAAKPPGQETP